MAKIVLKKVWMGLLVVAAAYCIGCYVWAGVVMALCTLLWGELGKAGGILIVLSPGAGIAAAAIALSVFLYKTSSLAGKH
jgi:hypothetical protein